MVAEPAFKSGTACCATEFNNIKNSVQYQRGVETGIVPSQTGAGDMTITLTAGWFWIDKVRYYYAGGTQAIDAAHATLHRWDIVYFTSAGIQYTAGTAAANPTMPALPASSIIIASVYVAATDEAITDDEIRDERVLIYSSTFRAWECAGYPQHAYDALQSMTVSGDDVDLNGALASQVYVARDMTVTAAATCGNSPTIFICRNFTINTGITLADLAGVAGGSGGGANLPGNPGNAGFLSGSCGGGAATGGYRGGAGGAGKYYTGGVGVDGGVAAPHGLYGEKNKLIFPPDLHEWYTVAGYYDWDSGSGGGGGSRAGGTGGTGGTGANSIVILASGTITVTGAINVAGGNGANSSGDYGGGGGGGGGGTIILVADMIAGGGTITAAGGNGGNASGTTGAAGGGGGGNGGVILSYCNTNTFAGTRSVSGGTGGAKVSTGAVGSTGADGYSLLY